MDATLVRLVFAILALAGGAGILLYLALWVYSDGRRRWPAAVLVAVSAAALLSALGFSTTAVIGASLLIAGLAVVLVRGGSLRPGGSLPVIGVSLTPTTGNLRALCSICTTVMHKAVPLAALAALAGILDVTVQQASKHNNRYRQVLSE